MTCCDVSERLCFESAQGCRPDTDTSMAVVHACKEPCHRAALGYKERSLEKTHPHYLSFERPHHLYLNLIDPPVPLFKSESFKIFFDFVDREIATRKVLIHCNQGQSRAPSLALLYMAKRLDLLPNENYEAARKAFEKEFPYKPGAGIVTFLTENWAALG